MNNLDTDSLYSEAITAAVKMTENVGQFRLVTGIIRSISKNDKWKVDDILGEVNNRINSKLTQRVRTLLETYEVNDIVNAYSFFWKIIFAYNRTFLDDHGKKKEELQFYTDIKEGKVDVLTEKRKLHFVFTSNSIEESPPHYDHIVKPHPQQIRLPQQRTLEKEKKDLEKETIRETRKEVERDQVRREEVEREETKTNNEKISEDDEERLHLRAAWIFIQNYIAKMEEKNQKLIKSNRSLQQQLLVANSIL